MGSILHGEVSPRTRLYLAQLLEGCREIKVGRPATGAEYVERLVNDQLKTVEAAVEYHDDNWRVSSDSLVPVDVIVARVRTLIDSALVPFRNYVLFAGTERFCMFLTPPPPSLSLPVTHYVFTCHSLCILLSPTMYLPVTHYVSLSFSLLSASSPLLSVAHYQLGPVEATAPIASRRATSA